jgi:CDP-diacylglycerol--glycerol-3-phosphate 3-phosphatidyltransferase
LKSKILNAKRRIYLSTLYVGKSEHELVCFLQFVTRVGQHILTDV